MLILFPVLFIDLDVFLERISQASPAPRDLIPGILLGSLALILLVFANIFTNVWGYVKPVSLFFRGKFWLAYLLPAGMISLLVWVVNKVPAGSENGIRGEDSIGSGELLMGSIFLGTLVRALPVKRLQVDKTDKVFPGGHDLQYPGGQRRAAEKSPSTGNWHLSARYRRIFSPCRRPIRPASRSTTTITCVTSRTTWATIPIMDQPRWRAHMEQPSYPNFHYWIHAPCILIVIRMRSVLPKYRSK